MSSIRFDEDGKGRSTVIGSLLRDHEPLSVGVLLPSSTLTS